MRVPRFVIDELSEQTGVSFTQQSVFYLASAYQARSYSQFSKKSKMPRGPMRKACKGLAGIGWMKLKGSSRMVRPVAVIPHYLQEKMALMLREQYAVASNRGEFLMKRLLDFWIDNDNFVDNARPEFLKNPLTEELLEYDRFYLEGVAFEFNGSQHYGPTEKFPDDKELKESQARDLIKKALSEDHRVKLVTVTAVQLVPAEFVKLLPAELPRNCVDEDGPYFTALANLCAAYKARAMEQPGSARAITRPEPQKPQGLLQRQQATQPRTGAKK
ncbi:MAG: hypothetical protein Q8P50_18500 [Bacillota bacterium]|nr:hypothetical protein [Bacillota bacterium]